MQETFKRKVERFFLNFIPAYRGTGARVTYIAKDYREVRIKLPLNWRTKNYVGTIYGGSMYSAVDPIYMIMLIKNLGREYVVWDKSAKIRFKRPGKNTLFATFIVTEDDINEIKAELKIEKSFDKVYKVELKDKEEKVYAIIEKTIYIAKKKSHKKEN